MLSSIVMILISCSKNHTNPDTASIQGTYKLKSLSAKTNSTVTDSDGEKIVTLSDYTSINNSGIVVVDGSKFSATGLSYEVNSTSTGYLYEDNALIDSFSSPFNVKIPPFNSTAPYKLIGADSIYWQNGSITSVIAGSGIIQNGGNGGTYTLSGNLLTIKQYGSTDSTFQDSGITFHKVDIALATVVMEKQ
jgi:hypothetical protein